MKKSNFLQPTNFPEHLDTVAFNKVDETVHLSGTFFRQGLISN